MHSGALLLHIFAKNGEFTCFSMAVDSELELCARCVDKFKKMEISELFVVVIEALFAAKYLAECSIVVYKYFKY